MYCLTASLAWSSLVSTRHFCFDGCCVTKYFFSVCLFVCWITLQYHYTNTSQCLNCNFSFINVPVLNLDQCNVFNNTIVKQPNVKRRLLSQLISHINSQKPVLNLNYFFYWNTCSNQSCTPIHNPHISNIWKALSYRASMKQLLFNVNVQCLFQV